MTDATKLTLTPTINSTAIRHGDFSTATEALAYAAQGEAGFNFYNAKGELTDVLSYKALQIKSMKAAYYLKQLGFSPRDRLIVIAETSAEFLIFFFACQYSGLIPCPIAFSMHLGGATAYAEKLTQLIKSVQASGVVCSETISNHVEKLIRPVQKRVMTFEQFTEFAEHHTALPELKALTPFTADGAAYIQLSSGSTQNPKGVLITQRALRANLSVVLRDGMKLRAEDRSFNWLPFHHNMGIVGFMFGSVYGQRSVDCLSAEHFVQNPLIWPELMSRNKTAITFSPIFGYQLAMKALLKRDDRPQLDLSSLRIAGIGGDMIGGEMLSQFATCFSATGFNHRAFLPSYGLTETTLAVSTSDPDKEPFTDVLTDSITQQRVVSCGRVLPGFSVKVIEAKNGRRLAERQVGQIWVKGPSVIASYIDDIHGVVLDSDNFIYTGDLGYLYKEELFISGREKDVIIIRGRNIWAQDVEWLVLQALPEIGLNNVAAIGITVDQQEQLLLLVSLNKDDLPSRPSVENLSTEIQRVISQATGVRAQINFIKDTLPLTDSGKLARAKAKERHINNQFDPIVYRHEDC